MWANKASTSSHTLFRQDSRTIKIIQHYQWIKGGGFLNKILSKGIHTVVNKQIEIVIDPSLGHVKKTGIDTTETSSTIQHSPLVQRGIRALNRICQALVDKICQAAELCPPELRAVYAYIFEVRNWKCFFFSYTKY